MNITPLEDKGFGAIIVDVDLPKIDDEQFGVIKDAFLKYGFLVFPAQHLSDEENITFGQRFGELEFGSLPLSNQERNEDGSYGKIMDLKSQMMRNWLGNEAWHTDSTYMPISSKVAMLSAQSVPDSGGETELADARAGYAALDESTKSRIENLSAYHSVAYSQANDLGDFPELGDGIGAIFHGEAYLRPIVKVHPETGLKNLFIGRHAFGIPGLARKDSKELLKELNEFVVSDEKRVYSHSWQAGDLMVWDNRSLLHRARPYDYAQPRVLIGTRVAGDPETELSYYPQDDRARFGREALAAELALLREEVSGHRYAGTTATAFR
jgi:alpha-ketoglutarate-dependent taurine dioxygenase